MGGGSGYLTVGGVVESDGQWIQVASNWSNVQYVGGSTGGTDQLEAAVYDATTGSLVYSSTFGATSTVSHVDPTVMGHSFSVTRNQTVSLVSASGLSVSNPSGDSLPTYWIEDLGGGSGRLKVGRTTEPDGRWIQVASNWSNVQYVGGRSRGTDQLEAAVYDATTGSFVYSSTFSASTVTTGRQPKTMFDHSSGFDQSVATAIEERPIGVSDLLYHDDWPRNGVLGGSSTGSLGAASPGLLWHDKPTLLASDAFGHDPHNATFSGIITSS
jgi:hypothetical protein